MNPIALPADKATFLIVDDDPLARLELAEQIGQAGFAVAQAGNTADALALLGAQAEHFCGLITDINMPGNRSGIILANHVRYVWPHIQIIVVSAARRPIGGELPEAVRFLAKPVSTQTLLAAIAAFPDPAVVPIPLPDPDSAVAPLLPR